MPIDLCVVPSHSRECFTSSHISVHPNCPLVLSWKKDTKELSVLMALSITQIPTLLGRVDGVTVEHG